MKKTSVLALFLTVLFPGLTFAHCVNHKYYAGAGMMINSYNHYDDATGFQLLGGYCLDFNFNSPKAKTSIEVGYMDSGDFERTFNRGNTQITENRSFNGIWLSPLAEYKFDFKVHLLGRVGLDLGDDDGLLIGGGLGFNITKFAQLRAEYIVRDNVDSVQLNLITEF